MCKRNTDDPLLRMFLDHYQLHLLAVPREKAAVGDVYVERGSRVSSPGSITHLLDPPLVVRNVRKNEIMSDVSGRTSRSIEAGAGLGLLKGFIEALGGGTVAAKVHAAYNATGVRTIDPPGENWTTRC